MPDDNSFDSLFSEPPDVRTSVGDAEIEARKILGNDRYEKMIGFNDAAVHASITMDVANTNRLQGLANLYNAVAQGVVPVVLLLILTWSVYLMVTWALH